MLHLAPIFLGGSWAFWGGSFYPSNTLDRTLMYYKLNSQSSLHIMECSLYRPVIANMIKLR